MASNLETAAEIAGADKGAKKRKGVVCWGLITVAKLCLVTIGWVYDDARASVSTYTVGLRGNV